MSGVYIAPDELVGVWRIASTHGGQSVRVHRMGAPDSLVEVVVTEPVAGERLLYVLPEGQVYRVGDEVECAARALDVVHMNLLPVEDEHLGPAPTFAEPAR